MPLLLHQNWRRTAETLCETALNSSHRYGKQQAIKTLFDFVMEVDSDDEDSTEAQQKERGLQARLSYQDKTLAEKDKALAEKDKALAKKNKALAEKDKTLELKNNVLAVMQDALIEKNKELGEKSKELGEKSKALDEKIKALEEMEERCKVIDVPSFSKLTFRQLIGFQLELQEVNSALCGSIANKTEILHILATDHINFLDANDCTCTICSSAFMDPVRLDCGHGFCRKCILGWHDADTDLGEGNPLSNTHDCPICRTPFTMRDARSTRIGLC